MAKTTNSTIKTRKVAKKGITFNQMVSYRDKLTYLCGWNDHITEAAINQIATDLIDWANQPSSFIFGNFLCNYGIPLRKYYKWVDRYEQLKEAHIYALMKVGARREETACERNPVLYFKNLPAYCPITKSVEKFHKEKDEGDEYIDLSNCITDLDELVHRKAEQDARNTNAIEVAVLNKDSIQL